MYSDVVGVDSLTELTKFLFFCERGERPLVSEATALPTEPQPLKLK